MGILKLAIRLKMMATGNAIYEVLEVGVDLDQCQLNKDELEYR